MNARSGALGERMRPKSDAEKVNAEKVNLENVGTSSKLPAWKHFFDFFFFGGLLPSGYFT